MKRPSSISAPVNATPATFCAFDVLCARGADVRALPLSQHRQFFGALVLSQPGLQPVAGLEEHSEALLAQACELDLEGNVGKRLDSTC